jgi:hypothetical protein
MKNEEVVKTIKDCTEEIVKKSDNLEKILNQKSLLGNIKNIVGNYWLSIIIIVLIGISICLNISRTIIDSQNLVIGFIGALATFIVVSNYMQVKEIKDEFDRHVKDIEGKIESKVKDIENKFERKTDGIEKDTQKALYDAQKDIEKKKNEAASEAIANSLYVLGNHLYEDGTDNSYKYSLYCFVKSFYLLKKSGKSHYSSMAETCIRKIHQISGKSEGLTISEETKTSYLEMLSIIDDSDDLKQSIIQFITK